MLDSRQEQIADKMASVRRQQEESLRRREELLQELDLANQMTQRDEAEKERQKTERQHELEAQVWSFFFSFSGKITCFLLNFQVTARREQEYKALLHQAEELEDEKRAEEDYEEFLRREAEKMNLKGFQPKVKPLRSTSVILRFHHF